jgi:hypothetical protein
MKGVLNTTRPSRKKPIRWLGRGLVLVLLIWIVADVVVPRKHSLRQFDPAEVARLETAMWRSYYEKKPVLLFWQLAGGLRQQFQAPFWKSFGLAFQATRAAFVFKQGQSRVDYGRALPILTDYYQSIQELSREQFDVHEVAALELDWWVVHRQRNRYSYSDLAVALARTSAALYSRSAPKFTTYAQLRTNAMQLCDDAGKHMGGASEADWQQIGQVLNQAWGNLHEVVQ